MIPMRWLTHPCLGPNSLEPEQLRSSHGLAPAEMDKYLKLTELADVSNFRSWRHGGSIYPVLAESFRQIPVSSPNPELIRKKRNPSLPLVQLIRSQFEILQVTVSASGLPGVSPRNGDCGKRAFVASLDITIVLIPYHPGNAVRPCSQIMVKRHGVWSYPTIPISVAIPCPALQALGATLG